MGALAYREFGPCLRRGGEESIEAQSLRMAYARRGHTEKHMGIYLGEQRIGHCSESWSSDGDTLRIQSRMVLDMVSLASSLAPMPFAADAGEAIVATIQGRTLAYKGAITQMDMTVHLGDDCVAEVHGRVAQGHLLLRMQRGGQVTTRASRIDPRLPLTISSLPMGRLKDLAEGKTWRVATLNPVTLKVEHAHARVTHCEDVELENHLLRTYVVEVDYGLHRVTLWADERGEVVKQTLMGMTYLREPPPAAPTSYAAPPQAVTVARLSGARAAPYSVVEDQP